MKVFLVPVPVFDKTMAVDSYCFMFKSSDNLIIGDQGSGVLDGAVNPKLLEILDEIGIDTFTLGEPGFLSISNVALLGDFYQRFENLREHLVITLDQFVTPDPIYIDRINLIKDLGFKFAFNLPQNFKNYDPIFQLMDYILVDQTTTNKKEAMALLEEYPNAISVACNVNSYNVFELAKATGYKLFEGRFYRIPLTVGRSQDVSPLKIFAIQLLNAVREDNFELDEVARIVEKDIVLSVSLLRHINSQRFANKINNIQHAAAMIGQKEIRKWVSTTASVQLGADKPSEINKVSLIRAKFAENLAPMFELAVHADSLFLMGLFSVIDAMLDLSIDEALSMVAVADNIREALVKNAGPFYPVYEFIQFYEAADWASVSRFLILYEIDAEQIYTAYIDTMRWYKSLVVAIENEQ
ncbi:MAG: HDOD domain-containing protein [Defluviitaleaceae bacterium]|nr:HDOD domain-containing protein [Defluviitaleaceae bacterium]